MLRDVLRVVAGSVTELGISSSSHRRLEHLVTRHHDVTRSIAATLSATVRSAAGLHCSSASNLSQSLTVLLFTALYQLLTATPADENCDEITIFS